MSRSTLEIICSNDQNKKKNVNRIKLQALVLIFSFRFQ